MTDQLMDERLSRTGAQWRAADQPLPRLETALDLLDEGTPGHRVATQRRWRTPLVAVAATVLVVTLGVAAVLAIGTGAIILSGHH